MASALLTFKVFKRTEPSKEDGWMEMRKMIGVERMKKKVGGGTLAVLSLMYLLVLATPAVAESITITGPTSFTENFSYDLGGGNFLSATENFNVTSVSSSTADIKITLTNTTSPASVGGFISAMGFDTTPSTTASLLVAGTYFTHLAQNTTFPGFNTIDVCVYDGNNCSASGNHSLTPGVSDMFTLRLAGSFGETPSLTLQNFVIKDAGNNINGQSFELGGSQSAPVPEPASLLLLGSGLAGMAYWRRKLAAEAGGVSYLHNIVTDGGSSNGAAVFCVAHRA